MRMGDEVRVFPHGQEELAATGMVLAIDEGAIVVYFDERPRFASGAKSSVTGITVFRAWRFAVGPWVEVHGGGHYEIEPAPAG